MIEIKILVVEHGPENYGVQLAIQDGDQLQTDTPLLTELQRGYKTPWQAVAAMVQALTYQAPDTQVYDMAVNQVGLLMDANRDVGEAIGQLHSRLQAVEDRIEQLSAPPVPPQRINPLLGPGRQTTPLAPASYPGGFRANREPPRPSPEPSGPPPGPPQPPPIRRQTMGTMSHAGLISGGVARGRWAGGIPPLPGEGETE